MKSDTDIIRIGGAASDMTGSMRSMMGGDTSMASIGDVAHQKHVNGDDSSKSSDDEKEEGD